MDSILKQLRLQQYEQNFQKHNVDLSAFLEMNEQSLKSIGIKNDTDINVIIMCVGKLKEMFLSTLNDISDQLAPRTPTANQQENKIFEQYLFETVEKSSQVPDRQITETLNQEFLAVINNRENDGGTQTIVSEDLSVLQSTSSSIESNPPIPNHEEEIPKTISSTFSRTSSIEPPSYCLVSVPNDDPPTYFDAKLTTALEESDEKLPFYSCTIERAGYLMKKNEIGANDRRAIDRSWRKHYLHLYGTLLRVYKSKPSNLSSASPICEFSMANAHVNFAINYLKRRNVIRIKFNTGHQFLIQALDRNGCLDWIESLQSAANISSTLDDRKMPQFITLPSRRRQAMGYYAEMIREFQQVQIEEADDTPGLNW